MIFFITLLIVFSLDQITKFLVVRNLDLYESIPVLQDIFHITYIKNPGAAFGIFANQKWLFIIITILIVIFLINFGSHLKPEEWHLKIALGIIIGGALGNLFDRVRLGAVVDFFDFRVWPIFNVADVAIIVGMIFVVYRILFKGEGI